MVHDALVFGDFGIPTVMVSGDTATCREAHTFFGHDIVTVDVKKGYGEEFGVLLVPSKAHELITSGTAQSLNLVQDIKPYKIETPIRGRLRFPDKSVADGFHPFIARRIDDYTFEATIEQARYVHIF